MVSRLVIAAPASGQGKTTVATGLMAALTDRGRVVAPFKVGPDYIDPGYHSLATGRVGRNLDPVLTSTELIGPLFAHGCRGADLALIEGVMGLFDGRLGTDGEGSTAHVAQLLQAPVLLVVDARHAARSIAAVVHGMATFDPEITIAGVVLNQVGSPRHEHELRRTINHDCRLPVLGCLPRNLAIEAPSRHLGLVPAAERDDAGIRELGDEVARHIDLAAVVELAQSASPLSVEPWQPEAVVRPPRSSPAGVRPRIAIAGGRAFTFRYPETDELLVAAGCEPVVFDPLTADRLPEGTAGLWIGGGFPEVHATDLGGNASLRAEIRAAVVGGMPTVAECAGLLYLAERLDDHQMVAALPGTSAMTAKLTMGYRTATTTADSLLGRVGEVITGHEFHRTQITIDTHAGAESAWLLASPADGERAEGVTVGDRSNGARADGARADGVGSPSLTASYLHVHWAGHPQLAQRFADAAHAYCQTTTTTAAPDLAHHGDRDLAPGLVDLAVNVRQPRTPGWLVEALTANADWAAYPDPAPAARAIADHHGVPVEMVLPVAGAAEAFTLIARALPGEAVVVHPQFTEPEAALRAAQRTPVRHLLSAADGFRLQAKRVPAAELVLVGNPTNPTAVVHDRAELLGLAAGTLVVDEAFMDALTDQSPTLIAASMPNRLVLRSLTKTWAIAGIRAGYVVGDPALIQRLRDQQTPWSFSTPAVAATLACLSPTGLDEASLLADEAATARADLVARLTQIGLPPIAGAAPFVLVNTAPLSSDSLRMPLAESGFAVRRGESFPGLGPTWLRLAVREPAVHQRLVEALTELTHLNHQEFPC